MTSPLMGEACPVQSLLRRGRQRRHLTGERGGDGMADFNILEFAYRSVLFARLLTVLLRRECRQKGSHVLREQFGLFDGHHVPASGNDRQTCS